MDMEPTAIPSYPLSPKCLEVALAPNSGAAVTESPQRWMDMEPTAIPSYPLSPKSLEVALAPISGAAVTESPQRWMDMESTAIPSYRLARYPKEPSALHFAITHAQSNPIKHKLDTHVSLEWMLRAKKTLMDCIHHWLIANKKQNALNRIDNIYIYIETI
jgi:hypothetical protein